MLFVLSIYQLSESEQTGKRGGRDSKIVWKSRDKIVDDNYYLYQVAYREKRREHMFGV